MRTVILGMLFIQERSNNVLFGEQWHFKMMPTANFVKIEMRPVIVSTLHNREVQKAPIIQRAALLCIFFSSLRGWYNGTFLKYQSSYLYNDGYGIEMRVFCQRRIPNITKCLLVLEPHLLKVSDLEGKESSSLSLWRNEKLQTYHVQWQA